MQRDHCPGNLTELAGTEWAHQAPVRDDRAPAKIRDGGIGRGNEDNGNAAAGLDLLYRSPDCLTAAEPGVHQHERRALFACTGNRLFYRCCPGCPPGNRPSLLRPQVRPLTAVSAAATRT